MTSSDIRPPDLKLYVQISSENSQTQLLYTLDSPTGKAPFSQRPIRGPAIQVSSDRIHSYFKNKIEQLGERLDIEGEKILRADIERKLTNLGRQLFRELFPPEFCQAYRAIRRTVRTWVIISNEPWIPWELIKPYDDSQPEEIIDDDFLSRRFELTRWLAGGEQPSFKIEVRQLAVIQMAKNLAHSTPERDHLARLASRSGVTNVSPSVQSPGDLVAFLENGGVHLLHFIGHGFTADQVEESAILLPNGRPIRPTDLEGPVATQISRDRPLVFLNVCWGGWQSWSLTRTGGWADRWVGVCRCGAFVAPLWPVRDRAASEFARIFYDALWRGATLGQAAQRAREHLRATRPPGDPSTLAYTVYGDPNARVLFSQDASLENTPQLKLEKIEKSQSPDPLIERKSGLIRACLLVVALLGSVLFLFQSFDKEVQNEAPANQTKHIPEPTPTLPSVSQSQKEISDRSPASKAQPEKAKRPTLPLDITMHNGDHELLLGGKVAVGLSFHSFGTLNPVRLPTLSLSVDGNTPRRHLPMDISDRLIAIDLDGKRYILSVKNVDIESEIVRLKLEERR